MFLYTRRSEWMFRRLGKCTVGVILKRSAVCTAKFLPFQFILTIDNSVQSKNIVYVRKTKIGYTIRYTTIKYSVPKCQRYSVDTRYFSIFAANN